MLELLSRSRSRCRRFVEGSPSFAGHRRSCVHIIAEVSCLPRQRVIPREVGARWRETWCRETSGGRMKATSAPLVSVASHLRSFLHQDWRDQARTTPAAAANRGRVGVLPWRLGLWVGEGGPSVSIQRLLLETCPSVGVRGQCKPPIPRPDHVQRCRRPVRAEVTAILQEHTRRSIPRSIPIRRRRFVHCCSMNA